jgi:hypothetical protein
MKLQGQVKADKANRQETDEEDWRIEQHGDR